MISSLRQPADARLLQQISRGRAGELFGAVRNAEKACAAAQDALQAWEARGWFRRLFARKQISRTRNALIAAEAAHADSVRVFRDFVGKARASEAYRKAVGSRQAPKPMPAPPPEATPAPRERPPSTASVPLPQRSPVKIHRLTTAPTGSRIEALYRPRALAGPTAPARSRAPDRIYLAIPKAEVENAAALGATVGPRGGVFVKVGEDLRPFEKWLPFSARAVIEPLNVDLIPESSWGASLANLLLASSWKAVRASVVERTGDNCILCGFNGNGSSVDCHEIWQYFRPKQGAVGVQRLAGMIPVCTPCHALFHFGRARAEGRIAEVEAHLGWINRWSPSEVEQCMRYVSDTALRRRRLSWVLDLSGLADRAPLVLKGGKTGVQIAEDGELIFEDRSRQAMASTRFLGVRFGLKDQPTLGPLSPPDYSQFIRDV